MRSWRASRRSLTRCTPSVAGPSVPPERLLKACLLIALYSVRSERQFCEQLDYNLLFRWFLDLGMHEAELRRLDVRQEQGPPAERGRRPALL